MSRWEVKPRQGVTLWVDTEAFSDLLVAKFGKSIDSVAKVGAKAAQSSVNKSQASRIRVIPWKKMTPSQMPKPSDGKWQLKSKRIPTAGRRKATLTPMLRVPVALVVNNSKFSFYMEHGDASRPNRPVPRPMAKALDAMARTPGSKVVRRRGGK